MVYTDQTKKYHPKDLSSTQKKNVLRAWQYIETHPKININTFFSKVLGYIKCMENQLWIWGLYRYTGDFDDDLVSATDFKIVVEEPNIISEEASTEETVVTVHCQGTEEHSVMVVDPPDGQVAEGIMIEDGSFLLQDTEVSCESVQQTILSYSSDA
ncbi:unnamed protein product [Acanthoscelides obtectus]|nr:unnamed protein product [Acanthoscelides obtectus]CAK1668842.1 hypothetical protein AOBTE_LOCUS26635 [Acanthoscelides obtectus]